ncbi:MAG: hypothetical protein FJ087_15545 [Deltaproteobacteria bacterium]|nr:hypothetical protein [Deltaproteobacteria bacterium]
MATTTHETAGTFVKRLRDDVDAMYDGRIDDDEHRRRNRVTWDAIVAADSAVESAVLADLRSRLPAPQTQG